MTNPNPSPVQQLAVVLAEGNPRRTAVELEKFINHLIWRATGKIAREQVVQHSTTTRTY